METSELDLAEAFAAHANEALALANETFAAAAEVWPAERDDNPHRRVAEVQRPRLSPVGRLPQDAAAPRRDGHSRP